MLVLRDYGKNLGDRFLGEHFIFKFQSVGIRLKTKIMMLMLPFLSFYTFRKISSGEIFFQSERFALYMHL